MVMNAVSSALGALGGPQTRGGLDPAKIYKLGEESNAINFMFNPAEFTLSKQNSYSEGTNTGGNEARQNFQQGNAVSLKLSNIWFDTYNDGTNAIDVRRYTDPFFKLMQTADGSTEPPIIVFKWNKVILQGVLTSVTQTFTLFKPDGTPVRAKVDIDIKQKSHPDPDSFPLSTESAPNWPAAIITFNTALSLASIAAAQLSTPNRWKEIASSNNVEDPLKVKAGTSITVNK